MYDDDARRPALSPGHKYIYIYIIWPVGCQGSARCVRRAALGHILYSPNHETTICPPRKAATRSALSLAKIRRDEKVSELAFARPAGPAGPSQEGQGML